jgi:preprotein translocase subunit SecA
LVARPGAALGVYPEREYLQPGRLQQLLERLAISIGERLLPAQRGFKQVLVDINQHRTLFSTVPDQEISALSQSLRRQLRRQGQTDVLVSTGFALVREVVHRKLDIRMTDDQMMAGWIMLQGHLAEMADGAGKSLAIVLPACIAALSEVPVHVIFASDQLAHDTAETLRPVYEAMGLSMGLLQPDTPLDQRGAAYQCDLAYCSARQIAADYLQDRVLLRQQTGNLRLQIDRLDNKNPITEQLRLRGLCYAIVDNADTVLIDESLSPLILTRPGTAADRPGNIQGEVLARTIFPRFFQRYLRLTGVAANLADLSTELHATYGLQVKRVGTSRAERKLPTTTLVYRDMAGKWRAITDRVVELHGQGQPVLVATRSSEDSTLLGEFLATAGISPHLVEEGCGDIAGLLPGASTQGEVTVTSRWAGHNIDIDSTYQSQEIDGLHVILSDCSRARRIEERFLGYCAGPGELGSTTAMVSLEDTLAQACIPPWVRSTLHWGQLRGAVPVLQWARKKQRRLGARARKRSLRADRKQDELLAFSGPAG